MYMYTKPQRFREKGKTWYFIKIKTFSFYLYSTQFINLYVFLIKLCHVTKTYSSKRKNTIFYFMIFNLIILCDVTYLYELRLNRNSWITWLHFQNVLIIFEQVFFSNSYTNYFLDHNSSWFFPLFVVGGKI